MDHKKASITLRWVYIGCFVQFIGVFILTSVLDYLDQKSLLILSAVFGVLVAHLARNFFWDHFAGSQDKSVTDFVKGVVNEEKDNGQQN